MAGEILFTEDSRHRKVTIDVNAVKLLDLPSFQAHVAALPKGWQ